MGKKLKNCSKSVLLVKLKSIKSFSSCPSSSLPLLLLHLISQTSNILCPSDGPVPDPVLHLCLLSSLSHLSFPPLHSDPSPLRSVLFRFSSPGQTSACLDVPPAAPCPCQIPVRRYLWKWKGLKADPWSSPTSTSIPSETMLLLTTASSLALTSLPVTSSTSLFHCSYQSAFFSSSILSHSKFLLSNHVTKPTQLLPHDTSVPPQVYHQDFSYSSMTF